MDMKPGKHQASKQRYHDLCWKVHVHEHYVTNRLVRGGGGGGGGVLNKYGLYRHVRPQRV